MFDGASRDEILEYLQGARERVEILINCNDAGDHHLDTNGYSMQKLTHKINITNSIITSGVSNNRRNRTSNVSNSSTDSAVTTISTDSMDTEDESIKCTISNLNTRVERNDSGVGIETSKPLRIRRSLNVDFMNEGDHYCADCEHVMDPCRDEQSQVIFYSLVCEKCEKKRNERKEIISEFVDTEFKYGRDLRITREEFYKPIQVAGLLTKEHLKSVFINLDQLIEVNSMFSEKLQDALDIAIEQGDEVCVHCKSDVLKYFYSQDFTTVNIGKLFMECSEMLNAFETYCVGQGNASVVLSQMEKEKELLRVFLRVSQMENTLLRRMNLSAFLMVPVQRVTKYPLLLNRLYKVTPYQHKDREALRDAQQKVEMHLEHINQQTKGTGAPTRIWRRISRIWRPLLPAFTSNLLLGFT
ncbi:Myosin-M heavy chain-like protein [Leptotrombidium deliense]|uniref:Myosin-M heavy chain-like protein n=1 Tax=Leptotrombidium deliense TaxID=299467 RepID=A0A443SCP3_9ACAR|nr:Myosin-M heavy chain-like protein [Leptotrombidium deliense]